MTNPRLSNWVPPALAEALEPILSDAPPAAFEGLLRVLERAEPGLLEGLDSTELRRAVRLLAVPGAPIEALLADPADLRAAVRPEPLPPPGASMDALRVHRRRATLALAARELSGELAAPDAARELSDLADELLERALADARAELVERMPAVAALPLVVLALGKLGGRELNYSSDVDLVLVRGDEAPVREAERLARAFVDRVQRASAAGRLFRVDLRLRPYGQSGALTPRRKALVSYFEERGRTWEKQAWIKARPVAGARALGERLLEDLAPLHWKPLGARAIQEVVASREQIVEHTREAERDVKKGPGGLRDVEFVVQFLQLMHGGRYPDLRETGTLAALDRLEARALLAPDEAQDLRECYAFLRRLEHLLQLTTDREQTLLPRESPLAACLDMTPSQLEERFAATQTRARALLDRHLNQPFAGTRGTRQFKLQDLLLERAADPSEGAERLSSYGFQDPAAAWRHLESLAQDTSLLLSPSGRARAVLAGIAPRLLQAVAARPDPDRVLRNLNRIVSPLGAKATVFQLLAEAPDLLELLVQLASGSPVLVNLLANHPSVFDEVVDRLLTRAPLRRDEVERAALATRGDPKRLRELRALYLLQVAMPDLAGRGNLQNTGRGLADLAEGLLRAFVRLASEEAAARHGGAPAEGELIVFALGALGARELTYASDGDLVFCYTGSAPAPDGTSPAAFWGEVVKRSVALGESAGSIEGPLLPIDLRLRPGGRKGPLACAWSFLRAYLLGEGPGEAARDFERLAWQKARAVVGAPEGCAERERELHELLYRPDADAPALWAEVEEMLRRQREQAQREDLKRGPGGLAGLELSASALALLHGHAHPRLRQPNTAHLLDALEEAGLLDAAWHRDLRTAYAFVRRCVLRLRAHNWQARPVLPSAGPELQAFARELGYADVGKASASEHFAQELSYLRERVEAWRRTLG